MPKPSAAKTSKPRILYTLLFLYIGIAGTFEIVAFISATIIYFNFRNQVVEAFQIDQRYPVLTTVTEAARQAGLSVGDTVQSIDGVTYNGYALWHRIRWYAHPGDTVRVVVRKPGGQQATVIVPLIAFPPGYTADRSPTKIKFSEAFFTLVVAFAVPLFCLVLGSWVALARPHDPNAWFILVLLTYPQYFNPVGTFDWIPDWLGLRLAWHLVVQVLAPGALLFLGLLFPERARLDIRFPWLKWLVGLVLTVGLAAALLSDYNAWYRISLLPRAGLIDAILNPLLEWTELFCLALYWVLIIDKLRSASSPDSRRRLQVLLAGSVIGLGSILVIWVLLPLLGVADPGNIQWLDYLSAVLMLFFPLSLAYVVIVQRALDVRILLRMGTKYLLARATLIILRIAGVAALIWFIAIPLLSHRHSLYTTLLWSTVLVAFALVFFAKKSPTDLLSQWIDRKFFREAYDAEVMLANLAKTARTISDPAALIKTISHQISDILHVDQITVLLRRDGKFEPAYAIGQPSFGSESLRTLDQIKSSTPVLHDTESPHAPELLLPLPGRTQLLGAMALGAKRSEEPYTPADLRLLESVGVQTGLGLELSETAASLAQAAIERASAAREMEIAREVQERLFPQHLPVISGVTLAGACRTVVGVGGDYYDGFDLGDGRLGLAIGDVSGKGIPAALLMSSLRACLRTLTLTASNDLTALMRNMNRLIYEASAINRYATFFFGIYDPPATRLHYVNAGHNPPVLVRHSPDGRCQHLRLETGGPVIGLLPDACYEEGSVLFQPGDLLLTYTDGISEAMNAAEEEWGEEAMILAAQCKADQTAEDIVKAIFEAADAFTEKAPQHDDMTVLVMKLSALP
ncbi:MAG TPA: SpoIIE family protein phosphatase [Bryobacteraceae bacterium]|nr:SpoIIE family protein phosphatase [Bryobacteraceae bacterium]